MLACYSAADMTKPDEIARMIAVTWRSSAGWTFLVNNAGIQHVAPIEEFPPEKWDAIIAINLSSAFHCIRAVVPSMRRNGFGRIINIASAHGLVASPFKSAYVTAKHGMVGLTKVIALETAEQGITCNAVCPGYVYTPLVEAQIEGQAKAHGIPREQVIRDVLLAQQPNKRFATVEELGDLAVFLASDAAASITGVAFRWMAAGRPIDLTLWLSEDKHAADRIAVTFGVAAAPLPPQQWAHDIRNVLATIAVRLNTLENLSGPAGAHAAEFHSWPDFSSALAMR